MKSNLALGLVGALALTSCGLFNPMFGSPAPEEPISPDEAYLPTGGNNDLDLGPDQASLVEALDNERKNAQNLKEQIGRLTNDVQGARTALKSTEADLARTQESWDAAQHNVNELTTKVQNLETKVLILQIKNARAEQAKILLRLSNLGSQQNTGATPPTGVRR